MPIPPNPPNLSTRREKSSAPKVKRKHIRFEPDAGTYARIDPSVEGSRFKPLFIALVTEESYSGCGIVMLDHSAFKVGTVVRIKVGKLKPMMAEIRWRKVIDPRIVRLGLQFLE